MSRHKTIKDQELLEIAQKVFLEKGHAATTREIAEAAGISQGVLYQRFGSKNDLFLSAMLPQTVDLNTLFDAVDNLTGLDELEAYLTQFAERILDYFRHVIPLVMQLITYPKLDLHILRERHNQLYAEPILQKLAHQFDLLQQRGFIAPFDKSVLANTFVASLHGIAMLEYFAENGSYLAAQLKLEDVVGILLHGMAQSANKQQ